MRVCVVGEKFGEWWREGRRAGEDGVRLLEMSVKQIGGVCAEAADGAGSSGARRRNAAFVLAAVSPPRVAVVCLRVCLPLCPSVCPFWKNVLKLTTHRSPPRRRRCLSPNLTLLSPLSPDLLLTPFSATAPCY